MLGAFRKTIIGGASLGLIAIGMATAPVPVHAAPGDNVCAITAQPADVFNIEYGILSLTGHPANLIGDPPQKANGSWTPPGAAAPVPRFGLYYPVTDPVPNHAVLRQESFGGAPSSIPATPVQTGDHFKFAQSGTCANNGAGFKTNGDAIGYCGRSVGLGIGTVGGRASIVRWESVGSQLIFLDQTARGSVNAQANAPGDPKGSCKDGTAITFLVDGALVDTTRTS
jgi:hypothetical protein